MSTIATSVSQMYSITPGVPYSLDLSYRVGDANTIAPITYHITSKTVDVQLRVDVTTPGYFTADKPSFFIDPGATQSVTIKFLPEEANRVSQTALQQVGNLVITLTPVNLTGPVMVN